jgi:hypothetical protein
MYDTQVNSLGQIISTLRDAGFFVGILVVGWNARSLFQPVKDFFQRASKHMDNVEAGMVSIQGDMKILLNNHLSHIEADMKHIAGRTTDHVVALVDKDPLLEQENQNSIRL